MNLIDNDKELQNAQLIFHKKMTELRKKQLEILRSMNEKLDKQKMEKLLKKINK